MSGLFYKLAVPAAAVEEGGSRLTIDGVGLLVGLVVLLGVGAIAWDLYRAGRIPRWLYITAVLGAVVVLLVLGFDVRLAE